MPTTSPASTGGSRSPSPHRHRGPAPTGRTPLIPQGDGRGGAATRSRAAAIAPAPRAAQAQALPGHARIRMQLYRAIDRLTFRGTLAPLLAACIKLSLAPTVFGRSSASSQFAILAATGSGLQALLGWLRAGDTEHGFTWMSPLAPQEALEPPPTVAQWRLPGSETEQHFLYQLACAQANPEHFAAHRGIDIAQVDPRPALEAGRERLRRGLEQRRDLDNLYAGLLAAAALLCNAALAHQASQDLSEGRLDRAAYQIAMPALVVAMLLNLAGCRWQMRSREPDPGHYPRRAAPAPTAVAPAPSAQVAQVHPAWSPGPARHPGGARLARSHPSEPVEMDFLTASLGLQAQESPSSSPASTSRGGPGASRLEDSD